MRAIPTATAALLTALATAAGGCVAGTGGAPGAGPTAPVSPLSGELAGRWYRQWAWQEDVPASGVRAMSFAMSMQNRDWRPPGGPDGYAIRVLLQDALGRSVQAAGTLEAALVQAPGPGARPLYAWALSGEEFAERYRLGKPPGHVLRLDWGATPPPRGGTFLLAVRWSSLDGTSRFIQNIIFEDRARHAFTTTTRPATPGR